MSIIITILIMWCVVAVGRAYEENTESQKRAKFLRELVLFPITAVLYLFVFFAVRST